MQKHFISWNAPFLWSVSNVLIEGAEARNSPYDLRHQLLILPSKRASRRLLELLASKAHEAGEVLLPPGTLLVHELASPRAKGKRVSPSQRILLWNILIQDNPELVYSFYRGGS
jgi:hypothetical protein